MKRLPEAVPVANADQSDTPDLGRLVQSRLHLLTHRTIYHILDIISSILLDIILYIIYIGRLVQSRLHLLTHRTAEL